MSISAADVKKLRDQTGAGMMDCKKALADSNGDMDAAIELLRKKGQKVSEKRADREANQGVIVTKISDDRKKAVALELNCETDFVAKNEEFVEYANGFAQVAFDEEPADLDSLLQGKIKDLTVSDMLKDLVGKIGEKIDISRFEIMKADGDGEIFDYIHPGNQLCVLVAFEGPVQNSEVAKDVAMQVAAMNPISVNRDEVDASTLDKEKEIAKQQLLNEGKPEEIAEKAAMGKLRRFFEENVLLEQKFVKDGTQSVQEYLKHSGTPLVKSFVRIQLGGN
ncbi:translation elongation factor Ts [Natronogracilivirga saccharolytica]|uniref:Elongation factor Ts n=1 Tax=Natronogracilivirga saccharolytica TaxID=2812953 RepID=A0A8J7S877_9BACT|nr:translation elongation factor Ts [Natronogracilivirga saccharolytica]MBP3192011.1 elongation factor Ts [Natronogracilivirga saccharolytica]